MAYPETTLAGWFDKAKAGFRGVVGAAVDVWPNSWAVIAKVLAVLSREFDLRLGILFRQIFVSTADEAYVERHAFEYGIARRAASRAAGAINVTVIGSGTLPAGLSFQAANGALFRTISSALVAPGLATLTVQADAAGPDGNLAAGATLTLIGISPVALNPAATVASGGLSGGAPAETVESLRSRVLARKRNPPQGGSATDWIAWAREVPGVERVWVDSFSNTDRRVWLAFTRTGGALPNPGEVAAVQAWLDDPTRRPVTARVTVVAPVAVPVAVTATGVEPITPAVQAAINAELAALFAERMDVVTPNRAVTLPRAWLSEAISRAVGENRHTLNAPANDLIFTTPGQFPALGTVTLS